MNDFDPTLLSQVRLGVVSLLLSRTEASFTELRSLLEVTQGNLGMHMQKLEDAGYVVTKRGVADGRSRSSFRLTARGRRAFLSHVEQLKRIAGEAES